MARAAPRTRLVEWPAARRIIRSLFPPIDLFEDLADPADWPLLLAAEAKTNPRLAASVGALDLIPPERRVAGPGASLVMAPFTHVSTDRPSRWSDGSFGLLYLADSFETALAETIHHFERFMARTREPAGWTSQFRELVVPVTVRAEVVGKARADLLDPDDYAASQAHGAERRAAGVEALLWPSVRAHGGECLALFWPDLCGLPVQARHLDYHWDGARVDYVRDAGTREVWGVAISRWGRDLEIDQGPCDRPGAKDREASQD
ncbi:RES family NAD+ phosphorylase [Sphingomonas rosea]|uniref:RES family NAD+ phosphorylase n=1 Tax=Sphingomonas rosea TaxID=335605 RepID=A0ABP7UB53_9SPHN